MNTSGLYLLRQVFLSFSMSLILIAIVVPFLAQPANSSLLSLGFLAVSAVVSVVVTNKMEKPLDCASRLALAGSYRTRFFLRTAFANVVAWLAFVFALTGAPIWVFFVGIAFTELRLWTVCAPTRSALAADQRMLDERGCYLSLVSALMGTESR
jgi:hypothetical protein